MFGATFEHDSMRKMVILFGTLFNDIYINRKNKDGEVIQTLKVPLAFAPKEKMLARLNADPGLDKPVAIQLPVMAFEYLTYTYDPPRKKPTINKLVSRENGDSSKLLYQYTPVPYNVMFNLYIMVKNASDGHHIVEQILPFFTPEWTATVRFIDNPEVKLDVPIVLNDVAIEDSYEGNFENRRALIWTLMFTMKGYIFGPTKEQPVIKKAIINPYATATRADMANNSNLQALSQRDISILTYPGLTMDGQPTTNPDETIPYQEIKETDPWDFIIEYEKGIINE